MHVLTKHNVQPMVLLPLVLVALASGTAAAFVDPKLFVGAAALVFLSGLILRSPFIGILLVVLFLPLERIGAYESAIGTIRASQILAGMTLLVWFLRQLWTRRLRLQPNPIAYPLTIFFAISALSVTNALNVEYSGMIFIVTAFTALVGMIIPQIITSKQRLVVVLLFFIIAATLVSLFGLFQFFGDMIGIPSSVTGLRELYTKSVFGFPRIQSTFLEPLYFANFLLIPIGLMYALFLDKRTRLPSWISLGLLALFVLNLVLTVSRGGYLGVAMTALVMTIIGIRKFFTLRVIVPIVLGVLLIAFVTSQALSVNDLGRVNLETFTTHIQNVFFGASYVERTEMFEQALQGFRQSPLIGIGPGGFGPYVAVHALVKPADGWRIVNNEPLELLVETGMLGLVSMLAVIVFLVLRSVRTMRTNTNPTLRAIHLGLFGALLGMLVQYQTFSILYIMHIWILIGLLIATQNIIFEEWNHER